MKNITSTLFSILAILVCIPFSSRSQELEISRDKDSVLFHSIAPDDAQGYSSFIRMYPSSRYQEQANAILKKLNTSTVTPEQAMKVALDAGYSKGRISAAIGVKDLGKEHVFIILSPSPDSAFLTIALLKGEDDGSWKRIKKLVEPLYINDSQLNTFTITHLEPVIVNGRQQILFKYTNTSDSIDARSRIPNVNCELVFNLYSIRNNNIYNMMYSGKVENGTLYGKSLDAMLGDISLATEQQRFLTEIISNTRNLEPYDAARFRNQEVIQWWYDYNPEVKGDINFVLLPKSAKFIEMFDAAGQKVRAQLFSAAIFDNSHNNTVIVVLNRSTKKYSIAYCQTVPNGTSGLKLSGISLHEGNTIILNFENNGEITKRKLNLATKKLY